jgi:ABC-type dipeptide/oligopeptide/nickel transport system permease component
VALARYAAIRLAIVIPVIVLMLVLTFVLTHVLPGDPAVLAAGPNATAAQVETKRHQLGLDQPIVKQLGTYLGDLAQGNLGDSLQTGRSVVDDLFKRVPSTVVLITLGQLFGFLLAVTMAIWTADRDRGPAAAAGRVYGSVGNAMPDYFLSILLILIFYVVLSALPAPLGQSSPTDPSVTAHTGCYLLDAIIAGNINAVGAAISHLVLPVATMALAFSAAIYRVAKAAIEDARRAKYVDYATLMGCSDRYIRRQVLQNAAPPVLTMAGVIYGLLLGGAVIVETIFAWGGLGQYAVTAITHSDYNAVQGFVLVAGVFSVIVYLVVDLVHAALDPRVRGVV